MSTPTSTQKRWQRLRDRLLAFLDAGLLYEDARHVGDRTLVRIRRTALHLAGRRLADALASLRGREPGRRAARAPDS